MFAAGPDTLLRTGGAFKSGVAWPKNCLNGTMPALINSRWGRLWAQRGGWEVCFCAKKSKRFAQHTGRMKGPLIKVTFSNFNIRKKPHNTKSIAGTVRCLLTRQRHMPLPTMLRNSSRLFCSLRHKVWRKFSKSEKFSPISVALQGIKCLHPTPYLIFRASQL